MFIHVPQWKAYNPRRDIKHPTWFRFDKTIITDPKNLDITGREILAWIYVLTLCCESNADEIQVFQEHQKLFGRQGWEEFQEGIRALSVRGWLVVRTEPVQNPPATEPDPTRPDPTLFGADSAAAEIIPELEVVAPILEGRKISTDLQRSWIETYHKDFVIQKIRELRQWELTAGAKGKKKNWGRFYNTCFAKDWDKWSKRLPGGTNSQPPKKSAWARMKEEGKV